MNPVFLKPKKIGSYDEKDVIFLLKDLSNYKLEDSTENREKLVQGGQHYSETLPIEYQPPSEYVHLFWKSLNEYKQKLALYVGITAEQIYRLKGKKTVLVSLARAGTPIGILIRRYLEYRYELIVPHYSISIIRDRGIDENAIHYILQRHPGWSIQFIDGWTGKGAISKELTKACQKFKNDYGVTLDDTLAVLADPGYCSTLYGTREDFLIPSACLNSTVSGLVSRTVLNEQLVGPTDYHGAKFYQELMPVDVSNEYIQHIALEFPAVQEAVKKYNETFTQKQAATFQGMEDVKKIQAEFGIESSHFVKPGVGETTRVLLRRVPWKILMKDTNSPYVRHIIMLAEERNVEILH
ncbi:cysteine protease StiP family protein [Bacillus aquiflavi]|nr:cysteine protease StiP family protein [Bacillus aquiflavi]UAC46967.1 cysteine protease StiP family protein [Bacillus aquiflavi]